MKCICETKCFIDVNGVCQLFKPGDVVDVEKCPPHFRPLNTDKAVEDGGEKVDFLTASKDELLVAKWKPSEARAAIEEAYGVTIDITGGRKKIVERILDARERAVVDDLGI